MFTMKLFRLNVFLTTVICVISLLGTASVLANSSMIVLDPKQSLCSFRVDGNGLQFNTGSGIEVNNMDDTEIQHSGCIGLQVELQGVAGIGGSNVSAGKPVTDPLVNLPPPPTQSAKSYPDCENKDKTYTVLPSNSSKCSTLNPGYYPGGILIDDPNATVVFNPGIYILNNKGLIIHHGKVNGNGVLFYLKPPATDSAEGPKILFDSGKDIFLSGMTTGPYQGVLFYQDRQNNNPILLNDGETGTITFKNILYAPAARLELAIDNHLSYPDFNGALPGMIVAEVHANGTGKITTLGNVLPKIITDYLRSQFKNFPPALKGHEFMNCQFITDTEQDNCTCKENIVDPDTTSQTTYKLLLEQYNQGTDTSVVHVTISSDDVKDTTLTQLFGTDPVANGTLKAWCTPTRKVSIP